MSPKRLVSLDVFRGITIAGMVLVNNPGTWSSIYWPLQHAEWHGWTPTDLVFPFFLFIVGVSITLAFARRVEEGSVKRDLYFKVIKRTAIIFGLGLFHRGRAPAHRDLLPDRVADFSNYKSQDTTTDRNRVTRRLLFSDDETSRARIRARRSHERG